MSGAGATDGVLTRVSAVDVFSRAEVKTCMVNYLGFLIWYHQILVQNCSIIAKTRNFDALTKSNDQQQQHCSHWRWMSFKCKFSLTWNGFFMSFILVHTHILPPSDTGLARTSNFETHCGRWAKNVAHPWVTTCPVSSRAVAVFMAD